MPLGIRCTYIQIEDPPKAKCVFPCPQKRILQVPHPSQGHDIKGPHKPKCISPGTQNAFWYAFWVFFVHPPRPSNERAHEPKCISPGTQNAFWVFFVHPPRPSNERALRTKMHFQAPKMHFWFSLSIPQGHQMKGPHKPKCISPGPQNAF